MDNVTNGSDNTKELRDGYDLPVYGLDNGLFYYLHIPALCCIGFSLTCVIIALTLSFRHRDYKTFFSWTKSERFVVYLAICDGGFNVSHSMDHLQYIITKDHVRPIELCEFYGFMLAEFVAAQTLLVNVVAINAFVLMVFKKKLNFGKRDWRLLVWTFGIPFVCATASAMTDQFGPNRISCYFDGVKGEIVNVAFTTVPLLLVLIVNIVLYGITLYQIRIETNSLHLNLHTRHTNHKCRRAAQHMSMFVCVFFIQWGPLAVLVTCLLISNTRPLVLYHAVTVFSNLGGCLNLCVYLIIRHESNKNRNKNICDTHLDSHEIKAICSSACTNNDYNVRETNLM